MARPTQNQAQKALKDLLTSPKVQRQVTAHRKTQDPPQALSQAVKKGDFEVLCDYLRQNPTYGIPRPILQLMERLRFLHREIDEDYFAPDPTSESLLVDGDGWPYLPLGTNHAAHQALVELARAWVEGLLPHHTVQRIPPPPLGNQAKKRGPKVKVDSTSLYGYHQGRIDFYLEMLNYVLILSKPNLKRAKAEDLQHFEARSMTLVKEMHAQCGLNGLDHKYIQWAGWLSRPFTTTKPLPSKHVQTIVRQAMSGQKKSINPLNLICGLLALYERDDPAQFQAIRQLITRKA